MLDALLFVVCRTQTMRDIGRDKTFLISRIITCFGFVLEPKGRPISNLSRPFNPHYARTVAFVSPVRRR